MVLKSTGLSSRFQHKNRFWKICTGSWDIKQNVPKIRSPNQTCIILDVLANILGPSEYFSKPILHWNRELKPVDLSTMNPINKMKFFFSYKGVCRFLKSQTTHLKPLQIENDFPNTNMIYHNDYYQPIWKCDFFNFQPTLVTKGMVFFMWWANAHRTARLVLKFIIPDFLFSLYLTYWSPWGIYIL